MCTVNNNMESIEAVHMCTMNNNMESTEAVHICTVNNNMESTEAPHMCTVNNNIESAVGGPHVHCECSFYRVVLKSCHKRKTMSSDF